MNPCTATITHNTTSKLYSVTTQWPFGYKWRGGFKSQVEAEQWAYMLASMLGRKLVIARRVYH